MTEYKNQNFHYNICRWDLILLRCQNIFSSKEMRKICALQTGQDNSSAYLMYLVAFKNPISFPKSVPLNQSSDGYLQKPDGSTWNVSGLIVLKFFGSHRPLTIPTDSPLAISKRYDLSVEGPVRTFIISVSSLFHRPKTVFVLPKYGPPHRILMTAPNLSQNKVSLSMLEHCFRWLKGPCIMNVNWERSEAINS